MISMTCTGRLSVKVVFFTSASRQNPTPSIQNNSGLPQALCEPLLRQVGAAAASNRAAPDFRHRFQEGGRAKIDTYSVRFAPGIGANTSEGAPKAAFLKGLGLLSVRWRRL